MAERVDVGTTAFEAANVVAERTFHMKQAFRLSRMAVGRNVSVDKPSGRRERGEPSGTCKPAVCGVQGAVGREEAA